MANFKMFPFIFNENNTHAESPLELGSNPKFIGTKVYPVFAMAEQSCEKLTY